MVGVIRESKIEYCVVVEYPGGKRFCLAKFMHEEDARRYRRSRPREDYLKYLVYERREELPGEVTWVEL